MSAALAFSDEVVAPAANDNRILTRLVPKPGSGLDPIETPATYDATCGAPLTQTDALGNVTAYTLDDCLVETVTQPAVDDGTTPTFDEWGNDLSQLAVGFVRARDITAWDIARPQYGRDGARYSGGAPEILVRNARENVTIVQDGPSRLRDESYFMEGITP